MARREPAGTAEIWKRVIGGDSRAWGELVDRFEPLVFTVARRVGLEIGQAEDCAQNVWLSLYRNRKAIRDPERIPGWLTQTTRRRAIRMARQADRIRTDPLSQSQASRDVLPDQELLRLEKQAIVEAAIDCLDPRCRKLVRALFFSDQDKSYRQIATELGIKPNSLGPIRSRCLDRLRRLLEAMDYR
ncbi:MAG: sigma-70 family RNA polymerase sigma factor [bacterium]